MSTDIKSSNEKTISLTTYCGFNGRRVQITMARDFRKETLPTDKFFDHITLSKKQASLLAKDLLEFVNGTEEPVYGRAALITSEEEYKQNIDHDWSERDF